MKTANVASRRIKIKPADHQNLKRLRKKSSPLRERFIEDLKFHQFSRLTRKRYLDELLRLTSHYWQNPADLSDEDLRTYFNYLQNGCRYSSSSMAVTHAALTFFYKIQLPARHAVSQAVSNQEGIGNSGSIDAKADS